MKWYVFMPDGAWYRMLNLHNSGSANPEDVCTIELTGPDGTVLGQAAIHGGEVEGKYGYVWYEHYLSCLTHTDNDLAAALLDYMVEVRAGRVNPLVTGPPCPSGGRIWRLPLGLGRVYSCGSYDQVLPRLLNLR